MDDLFKKAIDGMRRATERLSTRDTGLTTQRTQEEVIDRLEQLIDAARQQRQQQQSSSQQQQQQQQDPGQQQSTAQQQEQDGADAPQDASDSSANATPPPFADGERNPIIEESRTEWGNLPERIRDMLLQGRRERYSSVYERLTRDYYRRLAEEGSSP